MAILSSVVDLPQTEASVTPFLSPLHVTGNKMVEMPSLIGEDYRDDSVPSSSTNAPTPIAITSSNSSQKEPTKRLKNVSRVVHHDYHDHSHELEDSLSNRNPVARGGVTTPFPIHLHEMLETIEREGFGHVVSWQPHGRCFVIHKQKEFIEHVMPTYTKHSKFPSFRRQLNLYGYRRITKGPDRGGYYHELFLRGKPFLARRMQRKCIKGTGVRCRNNPQEEPNFYKMEPMSIILNESEKDDERIKNEKVEKVTPTIVVSPVPTLTPSTSTTDVVNFEGKSFHLMDVDETWLEMESFLRSCGEYQIPAVNENEVKFVEIAQRVIC